MMGGVFFMIKSVPMCGWVVVYRLAGYVGEALMS